ncbi:MAG: LysR substrate-binding domain-containing protein [Hellea sp.]
MDRFRRMEIFNAVVEAGQFTRAAASLNLSKSAVSHAVTDLEKFLGLQLLTRSNRSLQLTEAGESYYEQSVRILSDLSELESVTRKSDKAVSGRIRLSAPMTYACNELAPIIAQFMDDNPSVKVELVLTETTLDLVEDGIDLAVRVGNLKDSRLISRKITTMSHIICASPDFLKRYGPLNGLDDLNRVNCLKFKYTPIWNLIRMGRDYKFTPKGRLVSNSGEGLREFAIAGQGVTFLPQFLAGPALSQGRLVRVLPDYAGRNLDVSIVRPPGRHFPLRVRRLSDLIAESI